MSPLQREDILNYLILRRKNCYQKSILTYGEKVMISFGIKAEDKLQKPTVVNATKRKKRYCSFALQLSLKIF